MDLELDLERFGEVHAATMGVLHVNSKFFSYTLERPWLNDRNDVSCIPTGLYKVKLTESARFKKILPQLLMPTDSKRTGIRMHSASYVHELEGCISCGYEYYLTQSKVVLTRSRDAINDLITLMSEADNITLRIHF